MNNGAFGENFPYSNFHDMNTDWLVKIAKDFLDQYTHIQQIIEEGEYSIQTITSESLTALEEKKTALEALLQEWYNTHSEDIANKLADALEEMQYKYTTLATQLTELTNTLKSDIETKGHNTLDSIPDEYQVISRSLFASFAPYDDHYIIYNTSTKIITFPGGNFVINNGRGYGNVNEQTIDISSITTNSACLFFLKQNNTIYAKAWNTTPDDTTDHFIGYIHSNVLHINGVPDERIIYTDSSSFYPLGLFRSPYGVGISSDYKVTYDYTTKDLKIIGGFSTIRGYGKNRTDATINVSSELSANACSLFMKTDGTIYAKSWQNCKATNPDDQWIGYIYKKHVFMIGVDPSVITVIDQMTKNVFCFGDSITAGVGATWPYHTWWKDWRADVAFYNWGVGSTGYVSETSDNVCVGNGVEGRGTWRQESGNNSVIKVMQSLTDVTIPAMTIQAGTNDYSSSVSASDFRTAVQNTLDYAQTRTAYILVITPFRRVNGENANSAGLKLSDYANIIKEECDARGILWVDGYTVGINPNNTVSKNTFMQDGLHPNNNGQGRIARYTLDILNAMLTNNG